MKHTEITLLSALVLLFTACGDSFEQRIPSAPVYIRVDLNVSRDQALGGVNSGVFYTTGKKLYDAERMGFGGVYVYHTVNTDLRSMYAAFDIACPVEAKRDVTVSKGEEGELMCSKCGSVFEVLYGTGHAIEGPANEKNYRLQPYTVSIRNERAFEVRN